MRAGLTLAGFGENRFRLQSFWKSSVRKVFQGQGDLRCLPAIRQAEALRVDCQSINLGFLALFFDQAWAWRTTAGSIS